MRLLSLYLLSIYDKVNRTLLLCQMEGSTSESTADPAHISDKDLIITLQVLS